MQLTDKTGSAVMRRLLSAVLLGLAIIMAPGIARARVGSGASFGSRGLRTYVAPPTTSVSPFAAQPVQRSLTPPSSRYAPPGFASPGFAPSSAYGRRSAFSSGLLGGLLGAGIGGLLFGGGLFHGLHGGGSLIGLLIQLALLYYAGRWLYRRYAAATGSARPVFAGLSAGAPNRFTASASGSGGYAGASSPTRASLALTRQDYDSFLNLLQEMQSAWSRADLARLQRVATPEMVSYFAEQLAEQASRGERNTVSDVRLEKGELSESWSEGRRDYATVGMRFSAIDVTRDRTGRLVDGSDVEHVTTSELWTFVRAHDDGHWLLSAIQQLR